VVWACIGLCTIDAGRAVQWRVVRIRGISILLLVWIVLWGMVVGGSKCESISDNVNVV